MSVTLVEIIAVGLLIARCGIEATRCSGGAAHRHGLGTCNSKGAAIVVEEDATTMTKSFLVRFILAKIHHDVLVRSSPIGRMSKACFDEFHHRDTGDNSRAQLEM